MSSPFASHPTINKFIKYAVKHGCKEGKPVMEGDKVMVRSLIGKNGMVTAMPILEQDEKHITPSVSRSLCIRLGIPDYHSN